MGGLLRIGLPLLEALDRISCGGLILNTDGEVHAVNETARTILCRERTLSTTGVDKLPASGRVALKVLLARAETRFRLDTHSWVVIARPDQRPLVLHAMVIPEASETGPHTAVMLVDLEVVPGPNRTALEQIFGLTPAEARLAALLAAGATPAEVAQVQEVSIATVRSQLASIYAKTRTHRQAELVSLISRLSILG